MITVLAMLIVACIVFYMLCALIGVIWAFAIGVMVWMIIRIIKEL